MRCGLDEQTERWTENQLRGQTQRVAMVTKHKHRLPREAVQSPSLEVFKSYLNMVLVKPFQVALLEPGQHDLQRYFPTSVIA